MKKSRTDWNKLRHISDDNIDYSDISELDENFFKKAEIRYPEKKEHVSMRLDAEVLDWFRSQGRGYQTRINAVLRAYIRAKKNSSSEE